MAIPVPALPGLGSQAPSQKILISAERSTVAVEVADFLDEGLAEDLVVDLVAAALGLLAKACSASAWLGKDLYWALGNPFT